MIGIIFQLASETIEVRIDRTNVYFRTTTLGQWATIDNLRIDRAGVLKEHPDLLDKENWKDEAIKRFKDKINNMETEEQRANYIISDLTKFGYKPLYLQRQGFRAIKL